MSEEIALACADLETVRQLRRALVVAMEENDHRIEVERALRTELEAARELGKWANNRRYWRCGICPGCGFGTKLDGSEFHGTGCVIAAYNATPKAPPMAPPPDWWWV
jgi:hypothetical protein